MSETKYKIIKGQAWVQGDHLMQEQLMIVPGYDYRIVKGMITNFHQPKSTLLLLVSAMIGEDWKRVYDFALKNDYRFLSFGDACMFTK